MVSKGNVLNRVSRREKLIQQHPFTCFYPFSCFLPPLEPSGRKTQPAARWPWGQMGGSGRGEPGPSHLDALRRVQGVPHHWLVPSRWVQDVVQGLHLQREPGSGGRNAAAPAPGQKDFNFLLYIFKSLSNSLTP